jgi:ribonuclease HI
LGQPLREATYRNVSVMTQFEEVTEKEVRAALAKDKGTRSVGIDEVPMSVLKKVGPQVAQEIAMITNACIREQCWPEQWKKAEIVCIWKKKGNQKEPKFYRPVSMLPAIARLVERMLAEQLKVHIAENKLLPKFQHGFRSKHSTETALIQLVDNIATAMDGGHTTLVASLDLAGAFDTLDREVLMRKLDRTCGIRGPVGALLRDYLQDRFQRVRKPEETGSWKENPWGVPQGSVLGPLLFVLYCSDIQDALGDTATVQYADDVTIVTSAESVEEAVSKMNAALQRFQEYATGNRLAAEPTKTQLMVCAARRRKEHELIKCQMDGHEIEPSQTMKVLGVTLDNRLSWEQHNAKAAGKASGVARSVARGTKFLPVSDRAILIQALAHPYLDYCQTALACPNARAQDRIRRAYNRTARIAARLPRSEPARERTKWPEWEQRREAAKEQMASRVFCRGEPECLRELLPEEDNRKMGITRSCTRGEIDLHQTALMIGRKAFRYWAPEAYNKVCSKVATRPEPKAERKKDCKNCKQPEDCEAKQRAAYYAHLEHKYKGQREATDEQGRVIIYTDGSAVKHAAGGWGAGAGVFYGDGNKRNKSLRVNGPPTNQRAELAAVLHCLQNEERPMHIMTDSKYVQLGIEHWRHRWRADGWYKKALQVKEIDHADMWQRVDNLLSQKGTEDFEITWVKGHALPRHIAAGLTEERHIWGNTAADHLAGIASSQMASEGLMCQG